MGYRSHIIFVVKGEKQAVINGLAAFRLANAFTKDQLDALAEVQQIDSEACCINEDKTVTTTPILILKFEGQDQKWYDDYPEVQALLKLYGYFEDYVAEGDEEVYFEGAFGRIGEEDNDTESRSFGDEGYDLVRISRNMECAY
jgi:hypothetical protein